MELFLKPLFLLRYINPKILDYVTSTVFRLDRAYSSSCLGISSWPILESNYLPKMNKYQRYPVS